MFKSVKGCYCDIWWIVPYYRQNENWNGKLWEWVFSKILSVQICPARFAVDRSGENLVNAGRNWKFHVAVVEELMPKLLEFDSINYIRHASCYLKWIKALESESLYLSEKFMQRYFAFKDKQEKFNCISPDI